VITAGRKVIAAAIGTVAADAAGTVIAGSVVIAIAAAIRDSHRRAAEMGVAEAVGGSGGAALAPPQHRRL